jgi:hypothetical protein
MLIPQLRSIWIPEVLKPKKFTEMGFLPSFLRKQESRIWTLDQVRRDGVTPTNRTKMLASVVSQSVSDQHTRDAGPDLYFGKPPSRGSKLREFL